MVSECSLVIIYDGSEVRIVEDEMTGGLVC